MTDEFRDRMYRSYTSTHAGQSDPASESLSFKRDILPHLPASREARVVDVGCGQGNLVRLLQAHGYPNSTGIDISAEQVALAHSLGVSDVVLGDYRQAFDGNTLDVVTATDFFEHLTKEEVLEALDHIGLALRQGGLLILRVPNAVSPFSGNYQHGDITHETVFTARSIRQLAGATGFVSEAIVECPPVPHGMLSWMRLGVWKIVSAALKLALAAETGQLRGHLVTQNAVAVLRKK